MIQLETFSFIMPAFICFIYFRQIIIISYVGSSGFVPKLCWSVTSNMYSYHKDMCNKCPLKANVANPSAVWSKCENIKAKSKPGGFNSD